MSEVNATANTTETVTITVDGQQMQARKGAMLIEVTDAHNIKVPRFCYHKKLPIAANCRMCLVEVETLAGLCHTGDGWHGRAYAFAKSQRCTKIGDGIFTD